MTIKEMLSSERPGFAIWDLDETYDIDPQQFLTKGRSTPFEGWTVKGRCIATYFDGRRVYERA